MKTKIVLINLKKVEKQVSNIQQYGSLRVYSLNKQLSNIYIINRYISTTLMFYTNDSID